MHMVSLGVEKSLVSKTNVLFRQKKVKPTYKDEFDARPKETRVRGCSGKHLYLGTHLVVPAFFLEACIEILGTTVFSDDAPLTKSYDFVSDLRGLREILISFVIFCTRSRIGWILFLR